MIGLVISLPLGLGVIYVLAAIVWYELLRAAIRSGVRRRRGHDDRAYAEEADGWEQAELAESEREAVEQQAAEAAEPDPARRLYYLARKAAKAERDLAVQLASEATEMAVERIERRYREIDAELDEEEAERLSRG